MYSFWKRNRFLLKRQRNWNHESLGFDPTQVTGRTLLRLIFIIHRLRRRYRAAHNNDQGVSGIGKCDMPYLSSIPRRQASKAMCCLKRRNHRRGGRNLPRSIAPRLTGYGQPQLFLTLIISNFRKLQRWAVTATRLIPTCVGLFSLSHH